MVIWLENTKIYEKILIASCLQDPDKYNTCKSNGITPLDFKTDAYRRIWEKIEEVGLTEGITPLIIVDRFQNKTSEEREKRLSFLEKMKNTQINEDDFHHAIKKTKERAILDSLLKLSRNIQESVNKGDNPDNILIDTMAQIFDIEPIEKSILEFNAKEATDATRKELTQRYNGEIEDGVPSGIQSLDREIRCFYYSLYSIIIGRPGHGKTTLMINCFLNNLKAGYKPVFFSLEMPAVHLLIKMIAIWTRIPVSKITNPKKLHEAERERIRNALNEMAEKEFYIVDAVSMNVVEFGMLLQKYIKKGCKVGYLDYIQLLKLADDKTPTEAGEFRLISKSVREIIKKVNRHGNMALVVGAQAGRTVEQRPIEDRIPTQRDLEWSSSLEQDAALIIGIMNREKYEGENCEYKNQLFVGFPKHRYEKAVKINLAFLSDIQYITDLANPERYEETLVRWSYEVEKDAEKRQQLEEESRKTETIEENIKENPAEAENIEKEAE